MTLASDGNVSLLYYFSLDMHWGCARLFLHTFPLLVIATVLEFISAQRPSVHEGSSCWSLLCHKRSLSVPQFYRHHPAISQASMGQWRDFGELTLDFEEIYDHYITQAVADVDQFSDDHSD